MTKVKNFIEDHILNILRFTPIVVVPLSVSIIIFILYVNNQNNYNRDVLAFKNDFIKSEKTSIQNKVLNAVEIMNIKEKANRARLKKRIRSKVYEAYSIVKSIYDNNKGKRADKEIQKLIVDALINVRFFDGRGYYFINSNSGKGILFQGQSKLNQKLDLRSWKDIKGNRIIQDQINTIKSKGEGFNRKFHNKLDIGHTKDRHTKEYEKISYVKNFEPYDWHIGTGDYLSNGQEIIQKEILDEMSAIDNLKNKQSKTNKYMMIADAKGKILYHPNSKLMGVNTSELKDINGKAFGKEILSIKSASYINYFFKNPLTGKISEKIGYFVYIPNWKWIVGSGFYIDNMTETLDKETQRLKELNESNLFNIAIFGLILFLISIFFSLFISRIIKDIFERYQDKIALQVNELQDLNTMLELRIDKAINEINQKNRQLQEQSRLAQMGEMISMIAHQWRQPLASISAVSMNLKLQSALKNLELEEKEEMQQYEMDVNESLNSIDMLVDNLTTTIDDFRNFYKPNKAVVTQKLENVISKSLNIIKASLISKHIEIIEEYHSKEDIELYDNEMMQVILNILQNAKDNFLDKKIQNPSITITTQGRTISICDNGGGISLEIIEKIFDPYFSTKDEKNGTGLGLYMSKTIVQEHHNGILRAENTDKGVCFIIELGTIVRQSVT